MDAVRLDGNSAGGMLREIFADDMTIALATCASCGEVNAVGALLAYGGAMGVILRCPVCEASMLRITKTPGWIRVDASGTPLLMIPVDRSS